MKTLPIVTLTITGLVGAIAAITNPYLDVSAQTSNLSTFRQQALSTHNSLRQKHGSPPLALDSRLNNLAQDWAQKLANTGKMQHRPNNKYGENIYYGWSSQPGFDVNGSTPVQAWYSEINK